MTDTPIILHEQQYQQLKQILNKLRLDSSARVVFLVDKNGQQIAVEGEVGDLDTTSLASIAAGNVAATGGMAQLIGDQLKSTNKIGDFTIIEPACCRLR